jgi:hypothetical protein
MNEADIPEPNYDDPNELYTFFGFTFYYAQVIEQSVVNLAVALQAKGVGGLTASDVMDQYKRLEGRTFGNVLNAARKLTSIPASMDADLEQALKYRNQLAHSFFVERSDNLLTSAGRKVMIDELRSMLGFLTRVDEEFQTIWLAAWKKIGVSQAWFEHQFEIIRQKSLADQGDA